MYGQLFHGGKRRVTLSNRTVRRAVTIVAMLAFLGALFSIRVIPIFTSFTATIQQQSHHPVAVDNNNGPHLPTSSNLGDTLQCHSPPAVTLLLPQPSFAPIHLKEAALQDYRQRRDQATTGGGTNSVQVDAADLQRAEDNIVRMLPTFNVGTTTSDRSPPPGCPEVSAAAVSGAALFNSFRNFLQERALDARPIMIDFGCALGFSMATVHHNATVICVFDDGRHLGKKDAHLQSSGGEEDIRSVPHRRPTNLLWLDVPKVSAGFLREPFAQLYDACNFVTLGAALFLLQQPLELLTAGSGRAAAANAMVVELLGRMLPSTAVILAALQIQPSQGSTAASHELGKYNVDVEHLCEVLRVDLADAAKRTAVEYTCEGVATVSRGPSTMFGVVRLVLRESIRPCRKTWGAPLIQWDRSQTVQFNAGAVTFRVDLVSKPSGGGNGAKDDSAKTSTTMRTIHPLQYIHSLNLDTLLGAGLAVPLRQQILGKMITSPRYSDPLPHNWVVSGGGIIERIDKVDLRYDKDVDESKGYWGHSTRGYLHLFTEHLCLQVAPNGLPGIAEGDENCRSLCRRCARECSYLPKASLPCSACMQCGNCIQRSSLRPQSSAHTSSSAEAQGSLHCQKKYSSMHAARNVWKGWERADRKHAID
ncbi:membrane-associated protein, putative [Bodo saltans]|uniref:Membrane-associated protein, putative n=1 Tax=Bodo saltans TaxID=75058 RepID=A0A0S4JFP6_BODSA|nr:membrane-associated protein, putative [Bodo saltans]|eukprot:CUG88960.1 membrane-associated protein, putative [Bodo saltans]